MNEFKNIARSLFFLGVFIISISSAIGQNSPSLDQGQIYGYITSCYTGDSLENVEVKASDGINEITGQTNSNGYYSLLLDPAIYELSFQLEGYINDTIPDIEVLPASQTEINKTLCDFPYPVDSVWAEFNEDSTQAIIYWLPPIVSGLEVTRYTIYKMECFDPNIGEGPEDGTPIVIGSASQSPKSDFGWNLGGFFGYAVVAIYNDTIHSTSSYSNILIGEMSRNVYINAQLCCDENCSGIEVNLVGHNYPYDSISGLTDTNCNSNFFNVIYGHYDILVSKPGYQDAILDSVFIQTDTSFTFVLEENISPPAPINLFVDSVSSISNWEAPNTKLNNPQQVDNYIVYLNGEEKTILPNSTFEYEFQDLTYGNAYEAKVRAKYGDSISGASTYNFISGFLQPINSLQNTYTPGDDTVPLQFLAPINQDSAVTDGLLSFNIYRNSELLLNKEYENESVFDTINFTDKSVYHGEFVYSISSVYDLTPYGFPDETGESMLISSNTIEVVIGSIGEPLKNETFQSFPNPASNQVTISSEKEITKIEVFNQMGQKVVVVENINSRFYKLDVSGLEKGSYILNLEIDGFSISKKLIVSNK